MDLRIETNFVNKCIKKAYRDRLLFELHSAKKRPKAISRFAHQCEDILQNSYTRISMVNLQSEISHKITATDQCYIISDHVHDGETITLSNGIKYCKESYTPFILIASRFIIIKPETEIGESEIYIFKNIV